MTPRPFTYPAAPHTRVHGPTGYLDYTAYKPWLRDEFAFRCVYCLERETWHPDRAASFSVDHQTPVSLAPSLLCEYDNLVYSCLRCNPIKQARHLPLDPARDALADHLGVSDDGWMEARTRAGELWIELLELNRPDIIEVRLDILLILKAKQTYPDDPTIATLYRSRFRYPADLPDLRALRPRGNARPEGVAACHFERRRAGPLPDTY